MGETSVQKQGRRKRATSASPVATLAQAPRTTSTQQRSEPAAAPKKAAPAAPARVALAKAIAAAKAE